MAAAIAIGFVAARDNDKSSEQVGAANHTPKP